MRVRALHDLITVAPDELAFRTGDVLTVLDENVPHDANVWVRAEKDGMVGLIPMNYFEVVPSSPRKTPSRDPSIPRRQSVFNGSMEDGTELSDSSSLLFDAVVTRRNSNRSRSGSRTGGGGGKTTASMPEIQMYPYDGMESPWDESTSSLFEADGEDSDHRVMNGTGGLLRPSEPWRMQQEIGRNEIERKPHTAPPSPSRHPMPAPSPRQLASTLVHAAVTKKPPPPPPARRSQSSTQVGTLVSSNATLRGDGGGGGGAVDHTLPPTLPPPYRRPPIRSRAATTHKDHVYGVSPFDS